MAFCNTVSPQLLSQPDLLRYFDTAIASGKFESASQLLESHFRDSIAGSDKFKEGVPRFLEWWIAEEFWITDHGRIIQNPVFDGTTFSHRVMKFLLSRTSSQNFFINTNEPAVIRAITALSIQDNCTLLDGNPLDKAELSARLNSVYPEDSSHESIPEESRAIAKGNKLTTNDSEIGPTISWCHQLGVLTPWPENAYFVDLAPMVEAFLPEIAALLGEKIVPADQFIKAVGEVLPFLDHGLYNSIARALAKRSVGESEAVSEVLSAAIFRLRQKKILSPLLSSDDPNTIDFFTDGKMIERVSKVEILL